MSSFGAKPPKGNRVTVCHAYTCKKQSPYTFSKQDIAEIAALMKKTKRADTAAEERRAVAYAIAWMEVKVGDELGIKDGPACSSPRPAIPPSRIASTRPPTPRAIC